MFKAIIEFKDNTQITIDNKREFVKFYFDKYANVFDERKFGDLASLIYGGIMIDEAIEYMKHLLKYNTDISFIAFECYQIKKQHQDVEVFALDKEALNNFMSMMGVNDSGIYAGATYYNGSFVWEVSKGNLVL